MQAYFEWMPIRAPSAGQIERVYRSFSYGDLFDLLLLACRLSELKLKYKRMCVRSAQ